MIDSTTSLAVPVNTDTVFADILQSLPVCLMSCASSKDVTFMREDLKPTTVGYWRVLDRLSMDFILP